MKSTIISMFIVMALLIAIPVFLLGEGDFAKNFNFGTGSTSDDEIEDLQEKAPKNVQAVVTDKKIEVYKWVDEYGVMQFSNTPPFEGDKFEMMVLSPDINIVDAIKIPEEEQEAEAQPQVFNLGHPYSPEGMKKMIDDTENIRETLNQRQVEQESFLQGILNRSE